MPFDSRTRLSPLELRLVRQLGEAGAEPILDVLNFRIESYAVERDSWRLTRAVQRLLRLRLIEFDDWRPPSPIGLPASYVRVAESDELVSRELTAGVEWAGDTWTWSANDLGARMRARMPCLAFTTAGHAAFSQFRRS